MKVFIPPILRKSDILNGLIEPKGPYSDEDATYFGLENQYQLTRAYFEERGHNLETELDGKHPDRVNKFLRMLRMKFYTKIYNSNLSTRDQLNFMIAKRPLRGYDLITYRMAFLEAMYIEGAYLLVNGDISMVTGIDLDTMQNMSQDVIRRQDRDFHKDALHMLKTLGLMYYGRYRWFPQGKGTDW